MIKTAFFTLAPASALLFMGTSMCTGRYKSLPSVERREKSPSSYVRPASLPKTELIAQRSPTSHCPYYFWAGHPKNHWDQASFSRALQRHLKRLGDGAGKIIHVYLSCLDLDLGPINRASSYPQTSSDAIVTSGCELFVGLKPERKKRDYPALVLVTTNHAKYDQTAPYPIADRSLRCDMEIEDLMTKHKGKLLRLNNVRFLHRDNPWWPFDPELGSSGF